MALTFWYDFSSSYSFLAALRMDAAAADVGINVVWQPFLLGPIFMDAGYGGSPNLIAPAKAEYMWRDIGRRAAARGEAFVRPEVFPQKSVAAGRAALALGQDERRLFSVAVFRQTFQKGRDIADAAVLREAALDAGLDPERVAEGASNPEAKAALFAAVEEAKALGVFGAPTFVTTDREVFWGDDRLGDALAWERHGSTPAAR